jgi:hypothetical protein
LIDQAERQKLNSGTPPSSNQPNNNISGVNVKTRKRNIVVPSDPGSFADAIIHIFHDAGAAAGVPLAGGGAGGGAGSEDGGDDQQQQAQQPQQPLSTADVEKLLDAGAKALDGAELDFSRYADTLFEVLFAGGRLGTGGALADDQRLRLAACVLTCPPGDAAAIQPFIKTFQTLIRRRPFLVKGLENTLNRLILSLEFYGPDGRKVIASASAAVFAQRIGCLPENVLTTLLNDRLVAKGTVLDFLTAFFRAFLDAAAAERAAGGAGGAGGEGGAGKGAGGDKSAAAPATAAPVDDLVQLLVRARVADRLLEFTPPGKRTLEALLSHLRAEGLGPFADWVARREVDARVAELQEGLAEMMSADPPHPQSEIIAYVKRAKQEAQLPDPDVVRVLWTVLSRSVPMTGKNGQQVQQALLARVKANHKLLSAFVTSARLELSLIVALQVCCYEDSRLLKLFADVLRALYACDLVGEDAVQHWYRKGSHPKGRNVFLKDAEPFIKWLEEAEEEDDEEEEEVVKATEKLAV